MKGIINRRRQKKIDCNVRLQYFIARVDLLDFMMYM